MHVGVQSYVFRRDLARGGLSVYFAERNIKIHIALSGHLYYRSFRFTIISSSIRK